MTIDIHDMDLVLHGIKNQANDLEHYESWLRDNAGHALPGTETAIKEVSAEAIRYRALEIKIYETCFKGGT